MYRRKKSFCHISQNEFRDSVMSVRPDHKQVDAIGSDLALHADIRFLLRAATFESLFDEVDL